MFVGHGLLAFALVALVGERTDRDRSFVLRVAVLAGLFATLPDVDVVYGTVGLLGVSPADPDLAESFWAAGNRVHRGATHSLVVGVVTASAVGLLGRRPALSAAGLALLGGVVAATAAVSGGLAAVVTLLFAAGAVGLAAAGRRHGVPAGGVGAAALVGLSTHPFGDLFTGTPPEFLYPFDATLVAERVLLSGDPTLHLLAAFGLELAVAWLALFAFVRLTDRRVRDHVDRRAALGAGYAAAALVVPAPTLEVSYHFVFGVLALGAAAVVSRATRPRPLPAAVTGLATVSLALLAYACAYLAL